MTSPGISAARAAVEAYDRGGDDAVLVSAISAARAAGDAAGARIDLAALLCTYGGAVDDDAAACEGLALFAAVAGEQGLTPDELSRALVSWANALVAEHRRTGAGEPLEQARAVADRVLKAASPGLETSDALSAVASVLLARHQDTGGLEPLDDAVTRLREAVAIAEATDDPDRDVKVHKLAVALSMRSAARLTLADHEEAVTLLRGLLGRAPAGSPLRVERLKAVAVALVDGHESFGLDTLGEAASLLAEAHAAARGRLRALIAADIAATLLSRFQQGGGREVLDQAASLLAAEAEQPGLSDVVRSALDARLGGILASRYIAFGAPEDLDAALEALGRARELNVLRGDDRIQFLSDLGASLHELHARSGLPEALTESIDVLETARAQAGSRSLVVRRLLANLGAIYLGHHEVLGDRESLDSAIALSRRGRRERSAVGQLPCRVAGQPGPGVPGTIRADGQGRRTWTRRWHRCARQPRGRPHLTPRHGGLRWPTWPTRSGCAPRPCRLAARTRSRPGVRPPTPHRLPLTERRQPMSGRCG